MNEERMNIKGIITGDVVNSTSLTLEQRKDLLSCLSSVIAEIKEVHPISYELYRGDSIQVVVENPADTLLVGLLLRAGIKGNTPTDGVAVWDVRISLGVGKTEYMEDSIRISDGEAFRLSGRGLDTIGKATLCLHTPWKDVNEEFGVSLPFLDDVICGWTAYQARTIFRCLLTGKSKKDLAVELGQTAQNVSRSLILAKEKQVRNVIQRFQSVITSKIQ